MINIIKLFVVLSGYLYSFTAALGGMTTAGYIWTSDDMKKYFSHSFFIKGKKNKFNRA